MLAFVDADVVFFSGQTRDAERKSQSNTFVALLAKNIRELSLHCRLHACGYALASRELCVDVPILTSSISLVFLYARRN